MNSVGRDRQQATGNALVKWVNNLPISQQITSPGSLNDGKILWEILHDLDPAYFVGDLLSDHSGNSVARWQNLKQISKRLILYVTEERNQNIPKGRDWGDLKLIAENSSTAEMVKLLSLVLVATVYSPIPEKYVESMMSLSTAEQLLIKAILDEVELPRPASPHKETVEDNESVSTLNLMVDPGLHIEETLGKSLAQNNALIKEKDQLQKNLHDLHNRAARLQAHNDTLQDRLIEAEEKIKTSDSKGSSRKDSVVEEMELRLQRQEELIASQETQLADYAARSDATHKNVEDFRKAEEAYQALQDQFDEVKTERDGLARKANTIDKYKQRLQDNQGLETENQLIRDEIEALRQQLNDYEEAAQKVFKLQVTVDEYKRILPKIEQDRAELQVMKKQLEFDNAALAQRCEAAKEQHAKDQEIIVDLDEKTRGVKSSRTTGANGYAGLDQELNSGEDTVAKKLTQNQKDKSEQLARTLAAAEEENEAIQQKLDTVIVNYTNLEKRYFDTYQDKLTLETSLEQVDAGRPIEMTEIYKKMLGEVDNHMQSVKDLDAHNLSLKQQLRRVEADLSIVSKDKLASLEELKRLNSTELVYEQNRNKELLQRIDRLDVEIGEKNGMLRSELLIGRHKAPNESSDLTDLHDALEQVKAAIGPTSHAEPPTEEYLGELTHRIAETRERLAEKQQHIEQQDFKLKELRERLRVVESTASTASQVPQDQVGRLPAANKDDPSDTFKAAAKQELENLRRENRLMATAFHDLSSRLQLSTATLQRRTEPNGFLNRQRHAVNQATAVRSR